MGQCSEGRCSWGRMGGCLTRWLPPPFPLTPGWRRRCCLIDAAPINAVIKAASRWSDTNTSTRPTSAPVKVQVQVCHGVRCCRHSTWKINSCICTCHPPRALASPVNSSIIFFHDRQPQLGSTSVCIAVHQLALPEHLPMNLLKGWMVLLAAKASLVLLTTSASTSLLPSRVGQVVGGGLCPATG